jgi:hypothetical protein
MVGALDSKTIETNSNPSVGPDIAASRGQVLRSIARQVLNSPEVAGALLIPFTSLRRVALADGR